MLEEIDESEYEFGIPSVGEDGEAADELLKTTKRKRGESVESDVTSLIDGMEEEEDATVLKKKSKKKKCKKPKKKQTSVTEEAEKNRKTILGRG